MEVIALDLKTPDDYLRSLALLRQSILLRRQRGSQTVVELKIQLYGGAHVSLFMSISDLYIVGFRGKHGVIYQLGGGKKTILNLNPAHKIPDSPGEVLEGIDPNVDHRSLGTFDASFHISDMQTYCKNFAHFESRMPFENVGKGLSLLVCMVAEAARFLEVQNEFAGVERRPGEFWARIQRDKGIYNPANEVRANEVVIYWGMGTRARSHFIATGLPWNTAHEYAKTMKYKVESAIEALAKRGIQAYTNSVIVCAMKKGEPSLMSLVKADTQLATQFEEIGKIAVQLKINDAEIPGDTLRLLSDELVFKALTNLLMPLC